MTATTLDLLSDILSLCNDAPMTECPHITLSHVTGTEGYREAEQVMLQDIIMAAQMAPEYPDAALEHVSHIVAVAVALGYAIGAGHAYESVVLADIVVPESLSGADWLPEGA